MATLNICSVNIVISGFKLQNCCNHDPIIFAFTQFSENIILLRYIHEKMCVHGHGMFSVLFNYLSTNSKRHLIHDRAKTA